LSHVFFDFAAFVGTVAVGTSAAKDWGGGAGLTDLARFKIEAPRTAPTPLFGSFHK
jgi:hypothetical protein